MTPALQTEIDLNFDHFQRRVGDLLRGEAGKFALIKEQNIVGLYLSAVQAERAGAQRYGDGIFSIQEVTDTPADLGFFTHAYDNR